MRNERLPANHALSEVVSILSVYHANVCTELETLGHLQSLYSRGIKVLSTWTTETGKTISPVVMLALSTKGMIERGPGGWMLTAEGIHHAL